VAQQNGTFVWAVGKLGNQAGELCWDLTHYVAITQDNQVLHSSHDAIIRPHAKYVFSLPYLMIRAQPKQNISSPMSNPGIFTYMVIN
jgi:hypothetical protein